MVSVGEFASPVGILSLSCEFSGFRMLQGSDTRCHLANFPELPASV